MAMNIGSSESLHGDPEVMMEMNTTPLIDVMLVLLVMLIITIPIQLHSVNVDMPAASNANQLEPPKAITIEVNANSQVLWDGMQIIDRANLEAKMQAEAAKGEAQPEIHFMPHRAAKYDVVAGVMATAQRLGLQKIGLANISDFAPQPKAP
ncbi:MAG: Biopolymer transport protein ExbD [Pseudomonadota bacterium]